MSWDSYIDNLVAQSKDYSGCEHIDTGCILGKDGNMWTQASHSKALQLTPEECSNVAKCFKEKDFTPMQAYGIQLCGQKYQFLKQEENLVLAKKKGCGGVTMQASNQAIIIGHCPEGKQQGNTNLAVCKIADYLESLGM